MLSNHVSKLTWPKAAHPAWARRRAFILASSVLLILAASFLKTLQPTEQEQQNLHLPPFDLSLFMHMPIWPSRDMFRVCIPHFQLSLAPEPLSYIRKEKSNGGWRTYQEVLFCLSVWSYVSFKIDPSIPSFSNSAARASALRIFSRQVSSRKW
jgi:hypothetical protein